MNKGKEYTFKNFKKFSVHKATIYRWMKKIDQNVVIKMFEKLKGKVHAANENGLNNLLRSKLNKCYLFVTILVRKLNKIFIILAFLTPVANLVHHSLV